MGRHTDELEESPQDLVPLSSCTSEGHWSGSYSYAGMPFEGAIFSATLSVLASIAGHIDRPLFDGLSSG